MSTTWVTKHHHVWPDHTAKPRYTQGHWAYLGLSVKIKCTVGQAPSGSHRPRQMHGLSHAGHSSSQAPALLLPLGKVCVWGGDSKQPLRARNKGKMESQAWPWLFILCQPWGLAGPGHPSGEPARFRLLSEASLGVGGLTD